MVSGAIASLISLDRQYNETKALTVKQIRELLLQSATDMGDEGRDDRYGAGLLNIRKLLDLYIREHHSPGQDQQQDKDSTEETASKPETGETHEEDSGTDTERNNDSSIEELISEDMTIDLHDFIRFCREVEGEDHFMTTLEAGHIHDFHLISEDAGIGNYRCSSCGHA